MEGTGDALALPLSALPGVSSRDGLFAGSHFLLPPGGPPDPTSLAAFGEHLSEVLETPVTVARAGSYQTMQRSLLDGSAFAAWAPPLVYARTEAYGGSVLVRLHRHGSDRYRAALIARRDRGLRLDRDEGLVAAWVARESIAGYLLPQVHLRALGVHRWKLLREERFVGSYAQAIDVVLAKQADLCAVWAPAAGASSTLDELASERSSELEQLGLTPTCPNDGVVAGPRLELGLRLRLTEALTELPKRRSTRFIVERLFEAERLEPCPAGSHREIYRLMMAALPT
jgi:phosphonate transport system substrate-binding protein